MEKLNLPAYAQRDMPLIVDIKGKAVDWLPNGHNKAIKFFREYYADKATQLSADLEEIIANAGLSDKEMSECKDKVESLLMIAASSENKPVHDTLKKVQERTLRYLTETNDLLIIPTFAWYELKDVNPGNICELLSPQSYHGIRHRLGGINKESHPVYLLENKVSVKIMPGMKEDEVVMKYMAFGYGGSKMDIVCSIGKEGIRDIYHYHVEAGDTIYVSKERDKQEPVKKIWFKTFNITSYVDHGKVSIIYTGLDEETHEESITMDEFKQKEIYKLMRDNPLYIGGECFESCVRFVRYKNKKLIGLCKDRIKV